MSTDTKIALSVKEQELVMNTEWILTKHAVVQKVYQLFGEAIPFMQTCIHNSNAYLPNEVLLSSPKISKGENYRLLPWVMLDYPRCFGKEDTLAIRSFFWWGHFVSMSLQLSGKYKTACLPALQNNLELLAQKEFYISIAEEPWEHHFQDGNFARIATLDGLAFKTLLEEQAVVKITKKISLQEWLSLPSFLEETFRDVLVLVCNQAPRR